MDLETLAVVVMGGLVALVALRLTLKLTWTVFKLFLVLAALAALLLWYDDAHGALAPAVAAFACRAGCVVGWEP